MQPITKPQIQAIKATCRRKNIESADMALSYSNNRTEHVSDLTKDEAKQLLTALIGEKESFNAKQIMVRKILAMAHEMRWELNEQRHNKSNKIDMERVNNWMNKYSYLHKPLDRYRADELPALVTQFSKYHESIIKSI